MLRGSYLTAGDRFTVRVGGVVVGIGKVAVQDAWSWGRPAAGGPERRPQTTVRGAQGERSLTVQTR